MEDKFEQYYCSGIVSYPLPEYLQEKARIDLGETPQVVTDSLEELRTRIKDDGGFRCPLDDGFLLCFLRVKKYDVNRTFNTMKHCLQMSTNHPELLGDYLPSILGEKVLRHGICVLLPQPDQKGRRIMLLRMGKWNSSICTLEEMFRALRSVGEYTIRDPATQVNGIAAIIDLGGISLTSIIRRLTPQFTYHVITFIQNSFPVRIKEIHVLNEPFYVQLLYAIIFPVLTKKIKGRMHFHGSTISSLHKFLDIKCLPENYGGNLQPIDVDAFLQVLYTHEDYFKTLSHNGYDASLATKNQQ